MKLGLVSKLKIVNLFNLENLNDRGSVKNTNYLSAERSLVFSTVYELVFLLTLQQSVAIFCD